VEYINDWQAQDFMIISALVNSLNFHVFLIFTRCLCHFWARVHCSEMVPDLLFIFKANFFLRRQFWVFIVELGFSFGPIHPSRVA